MLAALSMNGYTYLEDARGHRSSLTEPQALAAWALFTARCQLQVLPAVCPIRFGKSNNAS